MDVEICRICGNFCVPTEGVELVHLFEPAEENLQRELDFAIKEVNAWQLNISEDDGLPQTMCGNCLAKFRTINSFRQDCEAAQKMLRKAQNSQESTLCDVVETASSLDFTQDLIAVPATDSNEDIAKIPELTTQKFVSKTSNVVTKSSSNMAVISPDLNRLNYNITYDDLDIPSNFSMDTADVMAETNDTFDISTALEDVSAEIGSTLQNGNDKNLEQVLSESIMPNPEIQNKMTNGKVNASNDTREDSDSCGDDDDVIDEKPAQRIANYTFACNYCYCPPVGPIAHLIFKSGDELSQHFFDVHDPKFPYPCPKCPKLFSSNIRRNVHIEKTHNISVQIRRCPYCRKSIRTPLEFHQNSCTHIADWKCKICERKFFQTALSKFRVHQRSHYTNPKFRCEYCKQDFMRRSDYEEHRKSHAEFCLECNEYFPNVTEFKKHNLTVHDGKQLHYCKLCGKEFLTLANLQRHMDFYHNLERKKNVPNTTCPNCHVTFPSKMKLLYHQQRPKDENGQCILQFPQKSRLNYYCCPHCSKRFTTKSELDLHLELHDARLRSYPCDKCSVRCHTASDLQQHIDIVHMSDQCFVCDKCDERFGYKKDLENHKLYHAKLTFKCSACTAVYATEEELSEHIRLNHELICCQFCNVEFTRKELKVHQDSGPCSTNITGIESFIGSTLSTQNKSGPTQIDTLIGLGDDFTHSEQMPEDILDFLQNENMIHATDVPLNNDDYFISSLLDPDNEIVIT